MDQSDAQSLDKLNQTLQQALSNSHLDITSITNHALASPAAYTGIVFWVVIAAIAITAIYFKQKISADRIRLLQTLAEKGQPIPPELLNGAVWGKGKSAVNYIARGIILIGIGLAMILFFLAAIGAFTGTIKDADDIAVPFIGAFPLFIGLAYLGIGLYQRRHG